MVERIFSLLLLLLVALPACAQPPREQESVPIRGEPMYTVLPFDAIPAIDEPVFVGAGEADRFLLPHEPVIGVRSGIDVKAYSAWHLDHHEIVNDVIGETPIAVTW
jgi:hypothetical protein